MASSGQVVAHKPHWTQFFSMKRNCGNSGLSCKALAGQALTQLKHSVHFSALTFKLPMGAGLGRSMTLLASFKTAGACSLKWSKASSSVPRFSGATAYLANTAGT